MLFSQLQVRKLELRCHKQLVVCLYTRHQTPHLFHRNTQQGCGTVLRGRSLKGRTSGSRERLHALKASLATESPNRTTLSSSGSNFNGMKS
ncbi:hypothetical protein DPMN_047815 [Dreissena polymorpha]|uniref:Uncharacterized protein n=1 Tax=Dreissena polymorpha TaxID=45954 RepID=A0A9D4I285_DREPO|nr:hypothetical protein DPMN_047815 [Dreissena polymorpha]